MKIFFIMMIATAILTACSGSSTTDNGASDPDWYKLAGKWSVYYEEENYNDATKEYTKVPTTIEMTITKVNIMTMKLNYRSESLEGIVSKTGNEWILTKSVLPNTTYTMSFLTISDDEWTGSFSMMINTADYKYNGGAMKGTRKK